MTAGVVVQVTSDDRADWSATLRNLRNLLASGVEWGNVVVVVHGDALPMVLEGSPVETAVADRIEEGLTFSACANTIAGRGEDDTSLLDGVSVVPSGVAEVVRRQRDGWAYLKLP